MKSINGILVMEQNEHQGSVRNIHFFITTYEVKNV